VPEGHLIHKLASQLSELVGPPVNASSPQGRFAVQAIDGRPLLGVEAYGKNLLIDSAARVCVRVHLGMRGKWLRFAPVSGPGLPQVRLRLRTDDVAWDLIAPSRCDLLDADGRAKLIASLGPDPLRGDADPAEAYRRVSAYPGPIAAALLDQSIIAGAGNVFRAEVLHSRGIAPTRSAATLTLGEFLGLWESLRAMMATARDEGRIVTVDGANRLTVPEDRSRRVYKQATCYDCGSPVLQASIGGRTSYACPDCQPR
jgi:endonuclease-8